MKQHRLNSVPDHNRPNFLQNIYNQHPFSHFWSWDMVCLSWWCHQMEIFSVLLALCAGNSLVTDEFPSQRPVTWSFDVFFDLCLNKRLSKQLRHRWLEMPSCSLWHHCNVLVTSLIYVLPWSWLCGRQYCAILDHVIMGIHCIMLWVAIRLILVLYNPVWLIQRLELGGPT